MVLGSEWAIETFAGGLACDSGTQLRFDRTCVISPVTWCRSSRREACKHELKKRGASMKLLKTIGKWCVIVLVSIVLIYIVITFTQLDDARKTQTVRAERTVDGTVESAWRVISDVGNYHKVTSATLHNVVADTIKGLNMKRTCYVSDGTKWSETCTSWEEYDHFTFEVDTKAEDYPLPLTHIDGTWGLVPIEPNRTKIYIEFHYVVEKPWRDWIFISSANSQLEEGFQTVFDNWQGMIEQDTDKSDEDAGPRPARHSILGHNVLWSLDTEG
jgi:hypothetical protein